MVERNSHPDVIVVGGGSIGLFTALSVAEQGYSVTVLERNRVWCEASGVNAGSLAAQNKMTALVPYTIAAYDLWRDVEERLSGPSGFRQMGGYKVATSSAEVERLHDGAGTQRQCGLPVTWIDAEMIRSDLPWLSHDVMAATYCELDAYANPLALGPSLVRCLKKLGVTLVENIEITDLSANGTIKLSTSEGDFEADRMVICAGAWSGRVAALLGADLPVSLDVNMLSVTEPAPRTIDRIVTHARGILTVKQVSNGSCIIGGGWQGLGSIDDMRKDVDLDQLVHNIILASRIIPGLLRLHILRSWAGYEGVTRDSLPYLGALGEFDNVFVAACARGGFTLSPILGKLAGELVTTGQASMPVDDFNPGRFAHGQG